MKSNEEFRRTVFEKAEKYRANRKKRNKKIIETISLSSLCLIIGISAYFGSQGFDLTKDEAVDIEQNKVETTSPVDGNSTMDSIETAADTTTGMTFATTIPATTEMTYDVSTSVEATFATTTAVATMTTASTTMIETTAGITEETSEATRSTTTVADTFSLDPSATQTVAPNGYFCHGGFICDTQCGKKGEYDLYVCEDLPSFTHAMQTSLDECLDAYDKTYFEKTFNESFFENEVLVVIHVPDSYVWKTKLEGGIFTISADKQNPNTSGLDALIAYTLSKDTFAYATLIAPNA